MIACRSGTLLRGIMAAALVVIAGCGPSKSVNPFALRKENAQLKAALRQYQDQLAQAKVRADNLDADNEQLHNLLAQEQDVGRRRAATPDNLAGAAQPPSDGPEDWEEEPKEFGPARGRSAAANTRLASSRQSSGNWLPLASVPGAEVIQDGDAVRIRVTNTNLFDPGKATLKPGAAKVLDRVAASIRREYPGHLVGIEGHTDSDPIRKSHWKDNHELSVQRAMAVYEYLRTRGGLSTDQLYVAGYGPNVPVAPNRSASGKAQNRRVEFVVQPNPAHASADGARR